MTAESDFAPFAKAFPDSFMDDDGFPHIHLQVNDSESDPVSIRIDADGHVRFDTDDYTYLSFDVKTLQLLARKAAKARALFEAWDKSPTGQVFHQSHQLG